jgi:hypothetical protein
VAVDVELTRSGTDPARSMVYEIVRKAGCAVLVVPLSYVKASSD